MLCLDCEWSPNLKYDTVFSPQNLIPKRLARKKILSFNQIDFIENCKILAAQFPCIWPVKDYKLKNFYLTISSNQLYVWYKAAYTKAPKKGQKLSNHFHYKNHLALYNLSGLCIRMIVLRMTTIIVYGRHRGHESKEIIEIPFSGWMYKGIKCY